ncbi:hypothetical protein ACQZV8_14800 [Magnetococcales bacterium HHB-1]
MMDQKEFIEELRKNNPFVSSSAGDPWEAATPSVASVNGPVFQAVKRLIQQLTENPAQNLACLILGEAGSGKTHLVGRVLNHSRQSGYPFSFAYIQPLEDPNRAFRYLLRELVINLCQPVEELEGRTQLHLLLAQIMIEMLKKRYATKPGVSSSDEVDKQIKEPIAFYPFRAFLSDKILAEMQRDALFTLRRAHPDIDKKFLKVLFQYGQEETEIPAADWLKGEELDDEDLDLLGVSNRAVMQEAALEEEARRILISLGLLLGRYSHPLILCFDRLENLITKEQLRAQGRLTEFIVDVMKSSMPLLFARTQQWEDNRLSGALNKQIIERLETNQFDLEGCSLEQAESLVESRLDHVMPEQWRAVEGFSPSSLIERFQPGYSPRQVIVLANAALQSSSEEQEDTEETGETPDIEDKIRQALNQRYRMIKGNFNQYAPDQGRLVKTLTLLNGRNFSNFETQAPRNSGKATILVEPEAGSEGLSVIIVDVAAHPISVGAALRCGQAFLARHEVERVVYLRDERSLFPAPPRWPTTNRLRQDFEQSSGQTLILPPNVAAQWYALALLSYEIIEQSLTVEMPDGHSQPVTIEAFQDYIQKHLIEGGHPAFEAILPFIRHRSSPLEKTVSVPEKRQSSSQERREQRKKTDTQTVLEQMEHCLREAPGQLLHLTSLSERLTDSGVSISEEELLQLSALHSDRFNSAPSSSGTVIHLQM